MSENKPREMMERMGLLPKNFLHEIRNNVANNEPLVSVNESNVKSLINKHTKDGYIIVSPCRGYGEFGIDPKDSDAENRLSEINNKRIREMIGKIKDSGFSYTPVYGGFVENQGEENEENVYERSFIIYPYSKDGKLKDFNELYEFGIGLAKDYNQDSILVQKPGEKPAYVNQNGDIDFSFDGGKTFNDISQTYFTDLHKNTDKHGDIANRKPTRFSFTEAYVNPSPQCLSEAHIRHLNGEVFLEYRN